MTDFRGKNNLISAEYTLLKTAELMILISKYLHMIHYHSVVAYLYVCLNIS